MSQAEADRRRYARDKKKRIAGQKRWEAKEEREHPKERAKKEHARNVAPQKTASAKCAVCGSKENLEWHHTSYEPPKGEWRCPKHNPRGGAV